MSEKEAPKRHWYLVEVAGSGQRAIETDLDFTDMLESVRNGYGIPVYRQVVAHAVQVGPMQIKVAIVQIEEVSHLSRSALTPHPTQLSGRHIISIVPVAEESDQWREIRRGVLKDTTVIAKSKSLVFPGEGAV